MPDTADGLARSRPIAGRRPRRAVARAGGVGLALVLAALRAGAADWPQFRGPGRDGRSPETGLMLRWGEAGPRVLWRVPAGEGYSGVAVVGERLFTLLARGDDELAIALDAGTGRELWRHRLDATYHDSQGDGPRSTPTVADGTVYALGARGVLAALDAASGEPRWRVDLKITLGARPPNWGVATSPLVEGSLLLLDAGGRAGDSVVALDRRTGRRIWGAGSDVAGYSAPIAVTVGGVRQAIFLTGTQLLAVDPRDGKVLWRVGWETSYNVNAATPLFVPPDRLFVASGYDVGGALFRLAAAGGRASAVELWRSRGMKNQFSSSLVLDGVLYGFDNRTLKAVDAATGADRWLERGLGHGSLVAADGHLIVLSDRGELVVAPAAPDAFRPLSRAAVLSGKSWTAPSIAGGRLFLRNQAEIVAVDLRR